MCVCARMCTPGSPKKKLVIFAHLQLMVEIEAKIFSTMTLGEEAAVTVQRKGV